MRRPELPLILACCALLLAACSKSPTVKPVKIRGTEQVAPVYRVQDGPETKRRVRVRDMLSLAAQRLAAGDVEAADREAARALKLDPASAEAHTLLAAVATAQGRDQAAGEHYRRAAELAPDRGEMLNNYGAWLCANGYPAESLVWFDRALVTPGYASPAAALANAGGCALRSGQLERAVHDLRAAIELDPVNAYALASLAEYEFRQGRYLQARAFVERRLAAAPADASVLQLAADIEQRLGDGVAASRYLQRLRTEFPQAASANSGGNQQ